MRFKFPSEEARDAVSCAVTDCEPSFDDTQSADSNSWLGIGCESGKSTHPLFRVVFFRDEPRSVSENNLFMHSKIQFQLTSLPHCSTNVSAMEGSVSVSRSRRLSEYSCTVAHECLSPGQIRRFSAPSPSFPVHALIEDGRRREIQKKDLGAILASGRDRRSALKSFAR